MTPYAHDLKNYSALSTLILREDRILEFNPNSESWTIREERLSIGKAQTSVLFVSEDKVSWWVMPACKSDHFWFDLSTQTNLQIVGPEMKLVKEKNLARLSWYF